MEDYDQFVQQRLSHLRTSVEEHSKPPPSSSLIRFYGRPVLPLLLSGEQREEMQRYRDAAQKAAVHKKLKADSRMACVQTILLSVQLRKTPTLEELLQESETNTKSSYSHNNIGGSVLQSSLFIGTKDSLSLSPPPRRKGEDDVSLPPLTSTTNTAFFASNVIAQQSNQDGCLIEEYYNQQGSQPSSFNGASHQSLSSGYVTYDNVENTTSVSGRIDAERESHGFGSSEGAYNINMGGFFLHNTSNTIAKMPDIINHPPIDGEELERSGLESSFSNSFILVKDICCTSPEVDSVLCAVKSESSNLDSTEAEDNLPFTTVLDFDKDHNLDRAEGPASLSENTGISDDPQTVRTHHSPTTELHIQHNPTESELTDHHADEANQSQEPYRFSLQALLKKSQEYRRRQRMLRNQAKNTKIQDRSQEKTRARAEEQSLSDKENDEVPYKGALIPSVETSQKKFRENEMIESELLGEKVNFKSESTHLTRDVNTEEMTSVEQDTIFKNNKLNLSEEVKTEPKQISAFSQQQPSSTKSSPAFYLTAAAPTFYTGVGKYNTIPAPNICRSPVHCKSKGSLQDAETLDGAETSKRKVSVDTGLTRGHKVDEVNLGHQNTPAAVPPAVNLMVEGDVTSVSAKSSQQLDQLESNLCSLKVTISDLESTLTKNLENHGQTERNIESEFSFKGISPPSDCDYRGDKLRGDDDDDDDDAAEQDQDQSYAEQRRQSDSFKEDSGTEPSISNTNHVPLIAQVTEAKAVNVSKLRLVKTLATERGKEQGGQHGCRKPTAKCILSVTQQLRIPDIFRNVLTATAASSNISELSDTSNCPAQSRSETASEGHDSTHSPSLNQSYDVDAPSGLWLLEGSGSDAGSKSHLTPESEGEGQGGASKVKRRLLMHLTEETQERSADASRGAGSVVTPNSSTPRAAARWDEGLGGQEMQEQLKQAHAAQVRALQNEHRRQQEELLQALAARYRLLQSVSFPCSVSSSRLGDALTFPTLSQPCSPLSERYRPLLSAAVKGFLARRLLRTERVVRLVHTIRDTHQFLQALQQQNPGLGQFCSRQDLLLQERVTLQLRAARYEIHDIFFNLSAGERMQLIGWDRELAREREIRQQSGCSGHPRRKSSLSTATQKSLERKRGMMIQKKAAERHTGVVRTGHNTGLSAKQPLENKRGQFRANPQRVPKSTYSSRPR